MNPPISHEGEDAEGLFRQLTGARPSDIKARGDAILDVDHEAHYVEVKKCSSNTINQVRAIKFIPLVVWDSRTDRWHVMAPDEIVRRIVERDRGQHTEIALESATLRLGDFPAGLTGAELRQAVENACRRARQRDRLHQEMRELHDRLRALHAEFQARVRALLA